MRAVLDTNILARSVLNPSGPAGEVLRLLTQPPHALILSLPQLSELSRVLDYPRLSSLHGWTSEEVHTYLLHLQQGAVMVVPATLPEGGVVPHDVEDNIIVAAAVAGHVDVICTLDRHLRGPEVEHYCAQHGIRILTDLELLELLRESDDR
jgi:putative PIN family toxin of toxin-antitoxin system